MFSTVELSRLRDLPFSFYYYDHGLSEIQASLAHGQLSMKLLCLLLEESPFLILSAYVCLCLCGILQCLPFVRTPQGVLLKTWCNDRTVDTMRKIPIGCSSPGDQLETLLLLLKIG